MSHAFDEPAEWLEQATIDPEVGRLRPDYRALLIVAEGLRPGPSDQRSEQMLSLAEKHAATLLEDGVPRHPHLDSWHEAFRAFGAKPKRTRPSMDALIRRARSGLPRIDRLTDTYNALSVLHVLPIGGEDLRGYQGALRLTRSDGTEQFDTVRGGMPVLDQAEPGEVVWRDDAGVTCRRWNWRQCTRTALSGTTERAIFILDALSPLDEPALREAGDDLINALEAGSPGARTAVRIQTAS